MQTILAMLTCPETARSVLTTSTSLAGRLRNVKVVALHVRLDVDPDFVPTEEIMTERRKRNFDNEQARRSADLKAIFDMWAPRDGCPIPIWCEITGKLKSIVTEESRKAIMIVIGHPTHRDRETETIINAALFDAKASVLMAPSSAPGSIGRHPAVAWKPSEAADRAVEASLPLLLTADYITVLVGTHEDAHSSARASLQDQIAPQNTRFELRRFDLGSRGVGKALISEAKNAGCDLLIMGAYTHNKWLEYLFGGATYEILEDVSLPVLMHH